MASLNRSAPRLTWSLAFVAVGVWVGAQQGCAARGGARQSSASTDPSAPDARDAQVATTSPTPTTGPDADQMTFPSAADASGALVSAAKDKNRDRLRKILGPATDDLASGDPVQDANDLDTFARQAGEKNRLEQVSDAKAVVHVGPKDWPFPIPIEKDASGKWYFDTADGRDEILNRRIGDNELTTIDVVRSYADAQREYASKDRTGDSVLQYARKIKSTPGKRDGLYWPAAEGEEPSPFGPLVADAQGQGYGAKAGSGGTPYRGYFYRVLTKQGRNTPAGAYDYVVNARMIAGFALVAYPAQYGNTGVMTFLVNHDGKVYQKDLGPDTADVATRMDAYDPDATWSLVQ